MIKAFTSQSKARAYIVALLGIWLITGCATNYPVSKVLRKGETRHIYSKNYKINEKTTASIGDPLIKVSDYYVEKYYLPYMTPTNDFSASSAGIAIEFSANRKYSTSGEATVDGILFTVVPSDKVVMGLRLGILVKEDGTVSDYGATTRSSSAIHASQGLTISPPNSKMIQTFEERTVTDKGYENFELLFSGIDKNTITITYREYSPEGTARVAFFQTLTYDANAATIRYKDFKISIHDVNSERMVFTVNEEPKRFSGATTKP